MEDQQVGKLFASIRAASGESLMTVGQAAGIHQNTVSQIERWGIYEGLRALDLFKLAQYYDIDISTVAGMLGLSASPTTPDRMQPLMTALSKLEESDQEYVLGVLDVLLRGLRRRS